MDTITEKPPVIVPTHMLLLDAEQVAAVLGIDRATVFRMRSARELPEPLKLGRLTKWRRADIEAWVAERR